MLLLLLLWNRWLIQLGFDYALSNNCSSIWIFWNSALNCNVLCNTPQCISLLRTHGMVDHPFVISAIYGKCSKVERRDLWQCLENIALNSKAWIIGGDFNIVRTANVRLGGNNIDFSAVQEFNDFIFKCGLADFNCVGSAYTWKKSGQRMWQRLDRCLCNTNWRMVFSDCAVYRLNKEYSDHSLIVGQYLVIVTP